MMPVTSDTVRAISYHHASRVLRVSFRSGGTYDYYAVDPHLYEAMLLPHPWRRIGREIRRHRYRRIVA